MTHERLVGYLSYKDRYDRYHVTSLSKYNIDKWPLEKDYFEVRRITKKYKDKLEAKLANVDDYTSCTPWEQEGFYFVLQKGKLLAEKIYQNKDFEQCTIDDLLGYPIIIDAKIILYKSPKFKKVGCKIQAIHIKNLEPIVNFC
jgi:hypothetical protein